jgi:hypothetical protein
MNVAAMGFSTLIVVEGQDRWDLVLCSPSVVGLKYSAVRSTVVRAEYLLRRDLL